MKKSDSPQNRLALAGFLSRHGRVKEALDQWEPLWIGTTNPEELVKGTMEVLFSSNTQHDKAQLERIAGWIQKGLEKQPKSAVLTFALGLIRESQERFQDAETLYRQCVETGPENADRAKQPRLADDASE